MRLYNSRVLLSSDISHARAKKEVGHLTPSILDRVYSCRSFIITIFKKKILKILQQLGLEANFSNIAGFAEQSFSHTTKPLVLEGSRSHVAAALSALTS